MEAAVLVHDVLFGGLEHVGCELLAFVDDLGRGHADGHTADREAAAPVGSVSECGAFGRVAVTKLNALVRHAQLIGHDLAEGRLVALAV